MNTFRFGISSSVTPTFAGRSVGYEDVDPIPNSPATGKYVTLKDVRIIELILQYIPWQKLFDHYL